MLAATRVLSVSVSGACGPGPGSAWGCGGCEGVTGERDRGRTFALAGGSVRGTVDVSNCQLYWSLFEGELNV